MLQYRLYGGESLPPNLEGFIKAGANIGSVIGQFAFGTSPLPPLLYPVCMLCGARLRPCLSQPFLRPGRRREKLFGPFCDDPLRIAVGCCRERRVCGAEFAE